jgi:hypothetical protein
MSVVHQGNRWSVMRYSVYEAPNQKANPMTRKSQIPIRKVGFRVARWVSAASAMPNKMNHPKCRSEYWITAGLVILLTLGIVSPCANTCPRTFGV